MLAKANVQQIKFYDYAGQYVGVAVLNGSGVYECYNLSDHLIGTAKFLNQCRDLFLLD